MNHLQIYDDLDTGDFLAVGWLIHSWPQKRRRVVRGYFVGWLKLADGKRAIEVASRNGAYNGSWVVRTDHIYGLRRANPRSAER